MKVNQIKELKNFFNSSIKNLLINQSTEEINQLYYNFIKYYCERDKYQLIFDENYTSTPNDLFAINKIRIIRSNNEKKINQYLGSDEKKILFLEYRLFKNLKNKFKFINSYQYETDINDFITKELQIANKELINFCKINPITLFSETSKYLVNNNKYVTDQVLKDQTSHIINIRKSIYELKRKKLDIKNLYSKIKIEALLKKFNFLTY